jgi:glyoxylase-like metal-dependent hydrolase (beta-lactamase superfamily II)
MLRIERHGDVDRLVLTHWRSRVVGYQVSAYLVRGTLVDSGFPSAAAALARWLDEARPAGVMITHHHEDHAGNVALVAARGLPLALPAATLARAAAPERIGFYRRFTWGAPRPLARTPSPYAAEGLELVATPGHAPDHHVVWDADRETLFSGDLFVGVKVRVARRDEDPREHARQLRRIADLRPRRMFDAHRGLVADPAAALMAKADWMEETIDRIDRRTGEGAPVHVVAREVLGREDAAWWFSAGDYGRRNLVEAVLASREPRAMRPAGALSAPDRSSPSRRPGG